MLALLDGEPGASKVQAILELAQRKEAKVYLSLINLGEIIYIVERERGISVAQKTLAAVEQLPVEFVSVTHSRVLAAAHLKAQFPMAYADTFAVAAAQEFQGVIVTGDPEFRHVKMSVQIEWLLQS